MDQNNDILMKIFSKVVDIEEKMMTKGEFQTFKTEIYSHIDGFIKLHETLDVELVALRSKYDRLDERLILVEQRVGIMA